MRMESEVEITEASKNVYIIAGSVVMPNKNLILSKQFPLEIDII